MSKNKKKPSASSLERMISGAARNTEDGKNFVMTATSHPEIMGAVFAAALSAFDLKR